MGIINRFLLFFYALAIGVLAIGALAACLKALPERIWSNELSYAFMQQECLTAAAVFLALSLYFVGYCFFSGKSSDSAASGEVIVVKGGAGDVRVSVDAVRNLAEREARAVPSVRDAKVRIRTASSEDCPFRVEAHLILLMGANVPQVSHAVTENIKAQIRHTMDFSDVPVTVTVSDISNAPGEKRKRVV